MSTAEAKDSAGQVSVPVERGSTTENALPAAFGPIAVHERSEWLDALRGFALFGIILYNVQVFSGYMLQLVIPAVHPVKSALDPALDFAVHVLIQAKFYSLFSFLFGLGIALQLRRAQERGALEMTFLRSRLFWLLIIGLVHALLIWIGDILTVYAVFGFALLLFRNFSTRALLAWALFFLASPVLVYVVFLAVGLGNPLAGDPNVPPTEGLIGKTAHALAKGSYLDVVQANLVFYPIGWIRRVVQLGLPRIFGMFLLGVWAVRIGLPARRDEHRKLLQRWLVWGLALGLPANVIFAVGGGNDALLPATTSGLLAISIASLGIPLLTLAFVAMFALYWRRPRPDSLLVAAGRTALSQYLGHSVVCVILFYGFGFGLFGKLSYAVEILIAASVFVSLAWLGRAWLRHHRQGPMEALWRRLAYATEKPKIT